MARKMSLFNYSTQHKVSENLQYNISYEGTTSRLEGLNITNNGFNKNEFHANWGCRGVEVEPTISTNVFISIVATYQNPCVSSK